MIATLEKTVKILFIKYFKNGIISISFLIEDQTEVENWALKLSLKNQFQKRNTQAFEVLIENYYEHIKSHFLKT